MAKLIITSYRGRPFGFALGQSRAFLWVRDKEAASVYDTELKEYRFKRTLQLKSAMEVFNHLSAILPRWVLRDVSIYVESKGRIVREAGRDV